MVVGDGQWWEMVESAFIVPLLPVPQTGWRLLDHYYDGGGAVRVLRCKTLMRTKRADIS
ncbi:MAG: hypothetical protein ACJ795_25280 [Ktedonobacteraceae bacterium]